MSRFRRNACSCWLNQHRQLVDKKIEAAAFLVQHDWKWVINKSLLVNAVLAINFEINLLSISRLQPLSCRWVLNESAPCQRNSSGQFQRNLLSILRLIFLYLYCRTRRPPYRVIKKLKWILAQSESPMHHHLMSAFLPIDCLCWPGYCSWSTARKFTLDFHCQTLMISRHWKAHWLSQHAN